MQCDDTENDWLTASGYCLLANAKTYLLTVTARQTGAGRGSASVCRQPKLRPTVPSRILDRVIYGIGFTGEMNHLSLQLLHTHVYTARSTIVQSAVLRLHVVCPSVCL